MQLYKQRVYDSVGDGNMYTVYYGRGQEQNKDGNYMTTRYYSTLLYSELRIVQV